MNNILSFKSKLVSKIIDAIFNTDLYLSNITLLSKLTRKFDLFDELEKTTEKVVGDFIIKNYKLIKEDKPSLNNFMFVEDGHVIYSLEGLSSQVVELLWNKYSQ